MLSGGYFFVAAKVAISISLFVNQLNATNLKSSKTQFQFQFDMRLAQLSPSVFYVCIWHTARIIYKYYISTTQYMSVRILFLGMR